MTHPTTAQERRKIMATTYNSGRQAQSFRTQAKSGEWMPTLLLVGSIGIIILFLWALQDETRPPTDKPENVEAHRAPEVAKPSTGTQKPRSLGLTDSRVALGQHQPD